MMKKKKCYLNDNHWMMHEQKMKQRKKKQKKEKIKKVYSS
jgi:hypothetical protein